MTIRDISIRNIRIRWAIIACLALLGPMLAGCGARGPADPGGMSLMDRYNSGQALFAEADQTPAMLTARADAAREAGKPDLALRLYDQALESDSSQDADPALDQARLGKGLALLDTDRARVALAEFTALLEARPGLASAHEGAGRACLAEGRMEQAAMHFRAALETEPHRAACLRLLGAAHTRLGEHRAAAEAYLAAVDLDWTDTEALADAGMSLALTNRLDEALEAFMRVVRQGRPTARVYNNLGLVLYRMGRTEQALAAFTAAGGEAAAHNNLGWFLFQDGRFGEAVAAFNRAMELSPAFYVRAAENLKRARLAAGLQAATPAPTPAPAPAPEIMPPAPLVTPAAHTVNALDQDTPVVTPGDGPWRPRSVEATGPVYTVHVSSWQTRKHARLDASRLEGRLLRGMDMKAYVFRVDLGDKGQWWRVTTGSWQTLGEARAALARLENEGLDDLRIIRRRPSREGARTPAPDVKL